MKNADEKTVKGFGREWKKFDQSSLGEVELQQMFDDYFCIFPWEILPKNAVGFDAGCGSGRWAKLVAPRVGKLICVDASIEALEIAKKNLKDQKNCEFYHSSIDEMPIAPSSMDFGYSLGVLHHVPDTQSGIQKCVEKLKPGAPFLVYLSPLQKGSPLRHILLLSNFCDHSHNPIPKTRPTSHDTLLKSGKS
jgi:ubiquinone/menaquinone biosynthesis C-methylase UbiE